jgi:hypothetical protein
MQCVRRRERADSSYALLKHLRADGESDER